MHIVYPVLLIVFSAIQLVVALLWDAGKISKKRFRYLNILLTVLMLILAILIIIR